MIKGVDFASLCSLACWYDNPIPSRFLAPIDCFRILALSFARRGKTGLSKAPIVEFVE